MSENIENQNAIKVFYSYSHKDEEFREALETHLTILKRKGYIEEWHDRKIIPGKEWEIEIDSKLSDADLILILVSPDFVASDYCYSVEMNRAMELHESNKSVVVPIFIRPTGITDEPFARIQSLPKDRKPISIWDNNDLAWLDVVKGLKLTIRSIQENIQENIKRSTKSDNRLRNVRSLLTDEVDRIDAAFNSDDNVCSGVATGFETLDAMLDGIHNSDFWVIAARPLMGKTDFIINLLENVAIGDRVPVAFFSMQLSSNKLIRKLTTSLGRVDTHRQLKGNLTDEDWARLTSSIHILSEAESNIFINDKPEMTISELSDSIKELQSQHGIGVLILDGLQNLTLSAGNKKIEPEEISRSIKNLARELNLPIISTLPLSRELEQRINKRPFLADLGIWDNLQNDADTVIFLYRDEVYDYDSPDMGIAELIVAKNNDGPIGTVKLTYLQKYSTFENYLPEMYESFVNDDD